SFAVPVVAPLPDVAVHVEEVPAVGRFLTYRLGLALRMRLEPGVVRQLGFAIAETILAGSAGAAGIFPFGLGGQPIAVGLEVALPGFQIVARCQAIQLGALVAEADGIGPLRPFHGVL